MITRPHCRIIAECATNHGGNLDWMLRLIDAAPQADFVKFQAYDTQRLATTDPQYEWLKQAELTDAHIQAIVDRLGPRALFSVFDAAQVPRLRALGVRAFKVGHADRWRGLQEYAGNGEEWFVSYAWGQQYTPQPRVVPLSVMPLYPAPLTALHGLTPLIGYSDHTQGLEACLIMMACGARVIEKHFSIEGCPRRQPWDMDEHGLTTLKGWSTVCQMVDMGTEQAERWGA